MIKIWFGKYFEFDEYLSSVYFKYTLASQRLKMKAYCIIRLIGKFKNPEKR